MKNLKEYDFFKNFSDLQIAKLLTVICEKKIDANQIIFSEGSPGDALYIIQEGEVAIKTFIDKNTSKQKILAIMEKGDFFGEMAIFDNKPRSASAVATSEVNLLILNKDDFWSIIQTEPKTSVLNLLAINKVMADRLRISNQNFISTFEVSQIMATATNLNMLLKPVLDQLQFAIEKSDASFFVLYEEFAEEYKIIAKCEKSISKIDFTYLEKTEQLLQDILLNSKEMFLENLNDWKKYPNFQKQIPDAKTLMAFPIIKNEKFFGLLFVISFNEYNAFRQSNKLLAKTIASQISPAIESIKFREEEENRIRLREKKFNY